MNATDAKPISGMHEEILNMRAKFTAGLLACLLLALVPAGAQTPSGSIWEAGIAVVPTSATVAVTAVSSANYVFLDRLVLANTTGSAVTVTITDNSTNCNGGVCQIFPAVSVAANTVYSIDFGGLRAYAGIKWNAASSNAIHGWMAGRY